MKHVILCAIAILSSHAGNFHPIAMSQKILESLFETV